MFKIQKRTATGVHHLSEMQSKHSVKQINECLNLQIFVTLISTGVRGDKFPVGEETHWQHISVPWHADKAVYLYNIYIYQYNIYDQYNI